MQTPGLALPWLQRRKTAAAPSRPSRTQAMSLDTIIHSGLTRPSRPIHALVLMGGGARTAYQVGVLRAMSTMLGLATGRP